MNVYLVYPEKVISHDELLGVHSSKVTNLSEDGYGNVLDIKIGSGISRYERAEFTTKTENTYAPPSDYDKEWTLGRLTEAKVTHTGGASVPTEISTFIYDESTGILTSETIAGDKSLTKTYDYDEYGNKTSETISGTGVSPRTTTYKYSSEYDHRFLTKVINALGHTESRAYDESTGALTSLTGPNGKTTTWLYDAMGKKIKEIREDGTVREWAHRWGYGNSGYSVYTIGDTTPKSSVYYDKFGRVVGGYTVGKDGLKMSHAKNVYNAKGQLASEYTYGVGTTTHYHDSYGREYKTKTPSPSGTGTVTSTVAYRGLTTTITNDVGGKNLSKSIIKNVKGKTTKVVDAAGTAIDYAYDAKGRLLTTKVNNANTITMTYDNLGHKTKMIDPDLGTWYYDHNALGELARQIDANHNNTFITYDPLGRVIAKSTRATRNSGEWKHASWIYDTKVIGALSSVESGSSANNKDITKEYAYDSNLRPINEKVNISGKNYNTRTRYYEDTGFVSSVTHPNGYRVSYGYNNGQLEKVIEASTNKLLYAVEELDTLGRAHKVRYGNNRDEIYAYNRGMLTSVTGTAINLTYDYDTLGNIHTKRDWRMGKGLYGLSETYGYDSMNRLSTVNLNAHDAVGTYNTYEKYEYDKLGNIDKKIYTPYQKSTKTLNYVYNNHRPHAVSDVGSKHYTYDNNGNVINRDGTSLAYTAFNKPDEIHKGGDYTFFFYDASNARYQKRSVSGSSDSLTTYIGKQYEETTSNSSGTVQKNFIYFGTEPLCTESA